MHELCSHIIEFEFDGICAEQVMELYSIQFLSAKQATAASKAPAKGTSSSTPTKRPKAAAKDVTRSTDEGWIGCEDHISAAAASPLNNTIRIRFPPRLQSSELGLEIEGPVVWRLCPSRRLDFAKWTQFAKRDSGTWLGFTAMPTCLCLSAPKLLECTLQSVGTGQGDGAADTYDSNTDLCLTFALDEASNRLLQRSSAEWQYQWRTVARAASSQLCARPRQQSDWLESPILVLPLETKGVYKNLKCLRGPWACASGFDSEDVYICRVRLRSARSTTWTAWSIPCEATRFELDSSSDSLFSCLPPGTSLLSFANSNNLPSLVELRWFTPPVWHHCPLPADKLEFRIQVVCLERQGPSAKECGEDDILFWAEGRLDEVHRLAPITVSSLEPGVEYQAQVHVRKAGEQAIHWSPSPLPLQFRTHAVRGEEDQRRAETAETYGNSNRNSSGLLKSAQLTKPSVILAVIGGYACAVVSCNVPKRLEDVKRIQIRVEPLGCPNNPVDTRVCLPRRISASGKVEELVVARGELEPGFRHRFSFRVGSHFEWSSWSGASSEIELCVPLPRPLQSGCNLSVVPFSYGEAGFNIEWQRFAGARHCEDSDYSVDISPVNRPDLSDTLLVPSQPDRKVQRGTDCYQLALTSIAPGSVYFLSVSASGSRSSCSYANFLGHNGHEKDLCQQEKSWNLVKGQGVAGPCGQLLCAPQLPGPSVIRGASRAAGPDEIWLLLDHSIFASCATGRQGECPWVVQWRLVNGTCLWQPARVVDVLHTKVANVDWALCLCSLTIADSIVENSTLAKESSPVLVSRWSSCVLIEVRLCLQGILHKLRKPQFLWFSGASLRAPLIDPCFMGVAPPACSLCWSGVWDDRGGGRFMLIVASASSIECSDETDESTKGKIKQPFPLAVDLGQPVSLNDGIEVRLCSVPNANTMETYAVLHGMAGVGNFPGSIQEVSFPLCFLGLCAGIQDRPSSCFPSIRIGRGTAQTPWSAYGEAFALVPPRLAAIRKLDVGGPAGTKLTLKWPALQLHAHEGSVAPAEYIICLVRDGQQSSGDGDADPEQLLSYYRQLAPAGPELLHMMVQGFDVGSRYTLVLKARFDTAVFGLPAVPREFVEVARSHAIQWPSQFNEEWSMPVDWSIPVPSQQPLPTELEEGSTRWQRGGVLLSWPTGMPTGGDCPLVLQAREELEDHPVHGFFVVAWKRIRLARKDFVAALDLPYDSCRFRWCDPGKPGVVGPSSDVCIASLPRPAPPSVNAIPSSFEPAIRLNVRVRVEFPKKRPLGRARSANFILRIRHRRPAAVLEPQPSPWIEVSAKRVGASTRIDVNFTFGEEDGLVPGQAHVFSVQLVAGPKGRRSPWSEESPPVMAEIALPRLPCRGGECQSPLALQVRAVTATSVIFDLPPLIQWLPRGAEVESRIEVRRRSADGLLEHRTTVILEPICVCDKSASPQACIYNLAAGSEYEAELLVRFLALGLCSWMPSGLEVVFITPKD